MSPLYALAFIFHAKQNSVSHVAQSFGANERPERGWYCEAPFTCHLFAHCPPVEFASFPFSSLLFQDANVFLSLKGTLRTEEAFELDKCLNHTDKFERGSEDIFEFRFPPLGDILSAKIMHDNSGLTNPDVRRSPFFCPSFFFSRIIFV